MLKALRIYWSHLPNWFYFGLFVAGLIYIVKTGLLLSYWYLVLLWLLLVPFIEYFTHKYLLHMPQPEHPDKHRFWALIANRVHYFHHQDPKKVEHIFAEIWMTVPALIGDILLGWLLTWDVGQTAVFVTAILGYFLIYEWTHFIAHFDGYTPKNAYGRFLKKYHLWHHYKNEAYWYGITTPIADWIFGKWQNPHSVSASPLALSNRRARALR